MGVISPEFLQVVWGPLNRTDPVLLGELRSFSKSGGHGQTFYSNEHQAVETAEDLAPIHDVYFGVLRRTSWKGTTDATIQTTHLLWADFDAKNFRGKTGLGSAFAELSYMALTPHIIVDSGHGYHAYWLLDGEYPFAEAQKAMRGIERAHHSDHCSDAARILRVPGTINHKDGESLPVRIVKFDTFSPTYSLDAFSDYSMQYIPPIRVYDGGDGEWTPSDEDAPTFGEGERNHAMTRLAGAMVHRGMDHDDMVAALTQENLARCTPPLEDNEVLAIARSVERYR